MPAVNAGARVGGGDDEGAGVYWILGSIPELEALVESPKIEVGGQSSGLLGGHRRNHKTYEGHKLKNASTKLIGTIFTNSVNVIAAVSKPLSPGAGVQPTGQAGAGGGGIGDGADNVVHLCAHRAAVHCW